MTGTLRTFEAQAPSATSKSQVMTTQAASWGRMRSHAPPGDHCKRNPPTLEQDPGEGSQGSTEVGTGEGAWPVLTTKLRSVHLLREAAAGGCARSSVPTPPLSVPSPRVARFSALRDGAGPRRYWGRRGCKVLGAGLGPAPPGSGAPRMRGFRG